METNKKEHLERMIMGLEQAAESTKCEIPYYKPDDLQLIYAKKFLASIEDNLAKAKKELADLRACETPPRSS